MHIRILLPISLALALNAIAPVAVQYGHSATLPAPADPVALRQHQSVRVATAGLDLTTAGPPIARPLVQDGPGEGVHHGTVRLTSVEDIVHFAAGFTGPFRIDGNLIIEGTELTDLRGLEQLTAVDGNIRIQSNSSLLSLRGLESLVRVGGELRLRFNGRLTSLEGLDALAEAGSLSLAHNAQLASLTGLEGLRVIGEVLEIHRNALSSLEGLEGLESVSSIHVTRSQLRSL